MKLSFLSKTSEKENTLALAVQLKLQGQWTKWFCFLGTNFSWKLILSMRPHLRSSGLGANYDALPSPSNLHRWNITSKTSCKLCHKQIPTLAHVHGTCKFGLQEEQGHFLTWLYSSDAFFLYFDLFQHHTIKRNTSIKFLKAWSKPWKSIRSNVKLLRFSRDWKLRFELNNLVFPSFIAMRQ